MLEYASFYFGNGFCAGLKEFEGFGVGGWVREVLEGGHGGETGDYEAAGECEEGESEGDGDADVDWSFGGLGGGIMWWRWW